MADGTFSILTVCTGNVCRSPAVERLLASKLGPTVSVASAGTHALVGHPISEPMAVLLRNSGVEDVPFEARRLSEQMLREADLVLPLTRAQRSLVVELWPAAVRRTFTLARIRSATAVGRSIQPSQPVRRPTDCGRPSRWQLPSEAESGRQLTTTTSSTRSGSATRSTPSRSAR